MTQEPTPDQQLAVKLIAYIEMNSSTHGAIVIWAREVGHRVEDVERVLGNQDSSTNCWT